MNNKTKNGCGINKKSSAGNRTTEGRYFPEKYVQPFDVASIDGFEILSIPTKEIIKAIIAISGIQWYRSAPNGIANAAPSVGINNKKAEFVESLSC